MRRYPDYCCQKCGALIGYVGRFFQWTRVLNLHWLIDGCDGKPAPNPWLVDRDGRVYTPDRQVRLQAKK